MTRRRTFFVALTVMLATGVLIVATSRPAAQAVPDDDVMTVGGEMANPVVWSHVAVPTTALPTPPAPRTPKPATQKRHGTSAPAPTTSFQACVKWRESGNNYRASSSGAYGILPSTWRGLGRSGTAGAASPAEQDAAFAQLYARDGRRPWSPYDGC